MVVIVVAFHHCHVLCGDVDPHRPMGPMMDHLVLATGFLVDVVAVDVYDQDKEGDDTQKGPSHGSYVRPRSVLVRVVDHFWNTKDINQKTTLSYSK